MSSSSQWAADQEREAAEERLLRNANLIKAGLDASKMDYAIDGLRRVFPSMRLSESERSAIQRVLNCWTLK